MHLHVLLLKTCLIIKKAFVDEFHLLAHHHQTFDRLHESLQGVYDDLQKFVEPFYFLFQNSSQWIQSEKKCILMYERINLYFRQV